LFQVGQDLRLEENPLLSDISSLNHPISISGALVITGNSILSDCAVKSVCDYLAAPSSFVAISGNGNNCQSRQAVETACLISSVKILEAPLAIRIFPNPSSGLVQLEGKKDEILAIQVLDCTGRPCDVGPPGSLQLDLSALPQGHYWIAVVGKHGRQVVPVVKL
jgi:hypothetical protein